MRLRLFSWITLACSLFVILTLIAMFFYPGGTVTDLSTQGYQFFQNFFSDLGRTAARNGQPNWISAALFFAAMFVAGLALVTFSLVYTGFFTRSRTAKITSRIGAIFGVLSGLCFMGVAFTPANLLSAAHVQFVLWAFRLFPLAAGFFTAAILLEPGFPRRYALVLTAFTVLLVLYLILLTQGPSPSTPQGLVIQATGQKIIAYVSILSVLALSLGASRLLRITQNIE